MPATLLPISEVMSRALQPGTPPRTARPCRSGRRASSPVGLAAGRGDQRVDARRGLLGLRRAGRADVVQRRRRGRTNPHCTGPRSAPMSPIPGTLQTPPSAEQRVRCRRPADGGAALADSAPAAGSGRLGGLGRGAACRRLACRGGGGARGGAPRGAARGGAGGGGRGAAGALVAADAGRDMNSPLNTIASIAAASSRARAGRRAGRDRPARGWGSAISGGSCIRRCLLRGCRRLWLPTGSCRICVDPVP